jgi:hypothetical protein
MLAMRSGNSRFESIDGDRFTARVSSGHFSLQVRASAREVSSTRWVSASISPVFSASGIKRSGGISSSEFCRQRTRASTPVTRPDLSAIFG